MLRRRTATPLVRLPSLARHRIWEHYLRSIEAPPDAARRPTDASRESVWRSILEPASGWERTALLARAAGEVAVMLGCDLLADETATDLADAHQLGGRVLRLVGATLANEEFPACLDTAHDHLAGILARLDLRLRGRFGHPERDRVVAAVVRALRAVVWTVSSGHHGRWIAADLATRRAHGLLEALDLLIEIAQATKTETSVFAAGQVWGALLQRTEELMAHREVVTEYFAHARAEAADRPGPIPLLLCHLKFGKTSRVARVGLDLLKPTVLALWAEDKGGARVALCDGEFAPTALRLRHAGKPPRAPAVVTRDDFDGETELVYWDEPTSYPRLRQSEWRPVRVPDETFAETFAVEAPWAPSGRLRGTVAAVRSRWVSLSIQGFGPDVIRITTEGASSLPRVELRRESTGGLTPLVPTG